MEKNSCPQFSLQLLPYVFPFTTALSERAVCTFWSQFLWATPLHQNYPCYWPSCWSLLSPHLTWPGSSIEHFLYLAFRYLHSPSFSSYLSGCYFQSLLLVPSHFLSSKLGILQYLEFGPLFCSHLLPWWPHSVP